MDADRSTSGYAQVLRARGHIALLRLHLGGSDGSDRYAVVENDRLVFASEHSDLATQRFDQTARQHSGPADAPAAVGGDEDYLEKQPLSLPTLHGAAFARLAAQLRELDSRPRS